MTSLSWKITVVIGLLAISGIYFLARVLVTVPAMETTTDNKPNAYAYHISTLSMDHEGIPKNKLYAEYMAHYLNENTTKFHKLKLQIFHPDRLPIIITAAKAQMHSDNEIILLQDDTKLVQPATANNQQLEIMTSDVRFVIDQEYMETEQAVTIFSNGIVIESVGMNAYLGKNRLELLNHVHTKIQSPEILP